jgi:hypothetical protein
VRHVYHWYGVAGVEQGCMSTARSTQRMDVAPDEPASNSWFHAGVVFDCR